LLIDYIVRYWGLGNKALSMFYKPNTFKFGTWTRRKKQAGLTTFLSSSWREGAKLGNEYLYFQTYYMFLSRGSVALDEYIFTFFGLHRKR
jgi:hypothetical protein